MTTYDRLIKSLTEFRDNQIKFKRSTELSNALIFALKRHEGHGECRTITGVAAILDLDIELT